MTSNSLKKNSSIEDKRETLQLFQQQSQSVSKNAQIKDKENIDPDQSLDSKIKKKRRLTNFFQQSHELSKKRKYEILELRKQSKDDKIEKFIIYDDKEICKENKFQNKLREVYDKDDDIETTESVQKLFVDICLTDLGEGIKKNLSENSIYALNLIRLKRYYDQLDENDF